MIPPRKQFLHSLGEKAPCKIYERQITSVLSRKFDQGNMWNKMGKTDLITD